MFASNEILLRLEYTHALNITDEKLIELMQLSFTRSTKSLGQLQEYFEQQMCNNKKHAPTFLCSKL